MAEILLKDSTICRLCAEDNVNGEFLFTDDSELSTMINRYLPVKVSNDGKLPRTICPGCNIQLEATVQFFDLLIDGQRKIREMWKQQVDLQNLLDESNFIADNFATELNDEALSNDTLYDNKHNLSLQMEGLDKPKKKRGRPPKYILEKEFQESVEKDICNEDNFIEKIKQDNEFCGDKRGKRKIKVPKRYLETLQGKELEKIFKQTHVKTNFLENFNDSEIIGHLITQSGENLNQPVIHKNSKNHLNNQQTKKKKYKFMCSFCGKNFKQRNNYIVHKSLHKITTFKCNVCQNQFSQKEELQIHQNDTGHLEEVIQKNQELDAKHDELCTTDESSADSTKNDSNQESKCTDDNDTSTNQNPINVVDLKETIETDCDKESFVNVKTQQDVNTFKCDKCSKHFDSKSNLETHIKVVHQGEKPYICALCNKAYAYATSLQGHIELKHSNETSKDFSCDICGKIMNNPKLITRHKLQEHNDNPLYECNKCKRRFKQKQFLQRHQTVHSNDRPYQCESCAASFKTKTNLVNHQSTHTGEKKHICDLCDMKFAHKTSLTLHYRKHTGQKPYKCEVCTKSFSQNGNLQEHMRIHTGEKPYCCDNCGRKFTTSSQFKLHVKRHTGERPWKCEICPKSFLDKDTWKCHVRRHVGERPFECPKQDCKRKFAEQWALTKHLRLHTGEKPYSCEVCGKAFADSSNLTKHKKVHENKLAKESYDLMASKKNQTRLFDESTEAIKINNKSLWEILPNTEEPHTIYVTYENTSNPVEPFTLQIDNVMADRDLEENTKNNNINFSLLDTDGNSLISIPNFSQSLSTIEDPKAKILTNSINDNVISKVQSTNLIKILQDEGSSITTETIRELNNDVQLNNQQVFELIEQNNQKVNGEQIEFPEQVLELITSDGQKVQYIKVDPSQLSSGLLAII